MGSFDSLNPFPVKGSPAAGRDADLRHADDGSPDEPSTEYGLIAEWVAYPADFSVGDLPAAPHARFHDGKPVTAEDVDLLARRHQEGLAQLRLLLQERRQGGEDGRRTGSPSTSTSRATASCR